MDLTFVLRAGGRWQNLQSALRSCGQPRGAKQADLSCAEMGITLLLRSAAECEWGARDGMFRPEIRTLQCYASAGQHAESSAAYVLWPPSGRVNGTAEERAAYFNGLHKDVEVDAGLEAPRGQQATTLLELMTIRAFHSKALRRYSIGTAVGFRTRAGVVTSIPAIIVFVARKVHKQWLHDLQQLPATLQGPGGIWCDVDVVEFSYYTSPTAAPKEQIYSELVEGLRGNDPCVGPGSQVASQETYGTLGAVVRSQTGLRQLGFLTNRHVAVDLDYPNQKMFHPLPPNLGPGVFLGAVERATSFITDDLWYGIFAAMNPESFVRADGAFIPFVDAFDVSNVTTSVRGVGDMGEVMRVDLQSPIDSVVGQHVVKVGRTSGLTKGVIMAYSVEYHDEKGICFFTDFLIVGENKQPFDLEGDSGSLILMVGEERRRPRPVGIIWGGTANRGRLKLRNGHGPENWTSGVDLGRLLDLLELDLIMTGADLLTEPQLPLWIFDSELKGRIMPAQNSGMVASLRTDSLSCRGVINFHGTDIETDMRQPPASFDFTSDAFALPLVTEGRLPALEPDYDVRLSLFVSQTREAEPAMAPPTRHDSRICSQEDPSLGLGLFDSREAKRKRPSG